MISEKTSPVAPLQPIVHTSGPWEPVRSLTCGHIRAAHNYSEDPAKEWTDADLRLIADAPEMLAALRELVDFAEVDEHHRYHERYKAAFNAAYDLLEKHGG